MTSLIFVLQSQDIRTSYAIGKNVSLQDKIKIKDNLDFTKLKPFLLSDKIKIKDNLDVTKLKPLLLSDKMKIKDNIDFKKTSPLAEKIKIKDNLDFTKLKPFLLSDKIKIKDNLDVTKLKPLLLSDKMKIKDNIDFKKTSPLAEKIKIKDNLDASVTHYGTITIKTLQKVPDSLVSGTSYTISPNPKTGSGNLLIIDGGAGDEDGVNDGMIKISQVPQGKYVINQVSIPSGFSSLLSSTKQSIGKSHLDQIITFRVVSASTDLTKLSSTPITSPSLSNSTFNKLKSLSAKIVSKTSSSTITDIDQTPQVIVAGSKNSTAIDTAVNSISSVLLNTTFAPLTSGSSIINTIGLENYTLPNSTNVVSVIPTILAKVNDTTDYVAATPPLSGIIPGQEMIIPIVDSLLPSFGGLKKIDVQSSQSVNSGINNENWFVFEVDKKIPSNLGSSGINNAPEFFVNLQHPFEESGVGFNWSSASNLAVPPTLTIVVNKTSLSSIKIDSQGCPVVDAYTLVSGSWTTSGITELSSRSISTTQCEITIQSQHLSKFVFSLQHLSTLTSSDGPLRTVSAGASPPPSNTAAAIQPSTTSTKPASPTGLTASASSTQINLKWSAPTSNGGSPITGYKIERSTNAGSTWSVITNTASTVTTYSNTGLDFGTTYTYRVSAINVVGTSSSSNTSSATIFVVPTSPTGLTAITVSTQINLKWSAPTSNGGSPITGYKIERSTNAGSTWTSIITNTGSTATTYSNSVTSGITYTYRVSAINVAGTSSPSNLASTTIFVVPSSPTGLTASASSTQINLKWSAPTSNGGSPITGYKIERSTNAGSTWSVITKTSTTTYSDSGIVSGTTYTYRVSAINAVGTSTPSNTAATTVIKLTITKTAK